MGRADMSGGRGHPRSRPDDKDINLYKVTEPFRYRDYTISWVSLSLLALWVFVLIIVSFIVLGDVQTALVAITAMMCALFLGWGIAALLSPLDATEEGRFTRLASTLGGVVSGFTLAKAGQIATFFGLANGSQVLTNVSAAFFVLAPLSCFLTGLISAFIIRAVVVSMAQNKRDILRRNLDDLQRPYPVVGK
jgi:hypothetical protein